MRRMKMGRSLVAAIVLGFALSGASQAQIGDSVPPDVTILPLDDSIHTAQLGVEVDFSDNGTLNPTRRNITFNGNPVTGFTHTGSGSSYTSTGTVTLTVGANTLDASICDTFGNCTSASKTWYYRPYINSVSVTPDGGWAEIPASTTRTQQFTVTNTGETSATYLLSTVCINTAFASPCTVSPTSVTLAPDAQQVATASFYSGVAGTTGTLRIIATLSGNAAVHDDGWFDFEVARPVATGPAPFAAIADPNPGTSIERSLCLTIAASSGANECGDLRLVHALPGVRTMNRGRAPVLLYNSQHARPWPMVAAAVNLPAATAPGDSVVAILRVNGVQRARGSWMGSQWTPGQTRRIALKYDGLNDTTGVYPYTLQVTRWGAGSMAKDTTLAGQLVVVNRGGSAFRPGWWLAGLEQLIPQADGSRFWVGGDGSTRKYLPIGTNAWRPETVDGGPDSLSYDPTAATYTRWVSGGVRVVFNTSGQHIRTLNRVGIATSFAYAGSRLQSITVPVRSGTAPAYTFTYDGAGLLYQVIAPPVGGQARITTLTWNAPALQLDVQDPDGAKVSFHHDGGYTQRIWGRTDRLGARVTWSYDAAQAIRVTRVMMKGLVPDTADLVTVYTNQQALGLAGTASVDVAVAYTQVDGPRDDVPDQTLFWLGRFGGPVKIQDATGRVTTIESLDPRFPGLATRVTSPGGLVSRATYDGRGNLRTRVEVNPYGDGRSGVTRYQYGNAAWLDFPTRVINPSGDSTVMSYDAQGNRAWVQDGRGDSTRVTFGYDGYGAVTSVRSARAAAAGENASILTYDPASGNLASTTTPLGFVSRVRLDEIGRDTASDSPVDGVRVVRTHHWYDVRSRDTLSVTYGDTIEGDLGVHTSYDLEGRAWYVTRWSTRGVVDTLQRRVQYDFADRVVNETQENGTLTYLSYDHAGNVIRSSAPRSAVTTTVYDVLNRPAQRISSPEDYTQAIRYLQAGTGQTVKVDTFPYPAFATSPGHFTIPADTAVFAYDPVTGATTRADNRDAWVRRTYYPNGQLATDTLRIRTWSETGAAGEFDAHVYPLSYTYDADGRRATLRHPGSIAPRNGATTALYDLEQYDYEPGSGALAWVRGVLGTEYRFYYDADLRTDSLAYPGQRGIGLTWDADGRLLRRLDGAWNFSTPGSFHAIHDVNYESYDQRGKALTIRDTYRYDQKYSLLGSLTEFKPLGGHVSPGQNTLTTYRVDALGHRMVESRFGASTETIYDYDEYGRMQGAHPPDDYIFSAGSAPLQQVDGYDAAGNQEWFTQQNFPTSIVDATRSFYDGNQRLVATDRQACYVESIGGSPPQFACRNWGNLDNATSGAFEWYRYDALGRRILARTRRDKVCSNAACASTITRFVWDGDQILYEIRAPGGNVSASQLEDDNAQGSFYGRVAYTHGTGIDEPLEIIRMGYTPAVNASYGLNAWNGPYPVMPYTDWHGMMDGATTATGTRIPCNTTPNLCSTGIWPASNLGAFYEPSAPADQQAWFGSLTSDKTDASGFMYMRNRYYNPQTGTFTQPDPIGLAGGLNVYGFAAGDPVSFSDPYGLKVKCKRGSLACYEWNVLKAQAADALRSTNAEVAAAGRYLTNMIAYLESSPGIYQLRIGQRSGLANLFDSGGWTKVSRRVDENGRPITNTRIDETYAQRKFHVPLLLVVAHEAGHAWAMMEGESSGVIKTRSIDTENAYRTIVQCVPRPSHESDPPPCR
jgi:RHS repeat-associated protein